MLQVSTDVLDLDGVVVTDRNAASGYARFYESAAGLASLDRDLVFAEWWTHPDYYEQLRRGSITCAEILVPDRVPPEFIQGIYVSGPEPQARVGSEQSAVPVTVNRQLFFC